MSNTEQKKKYKLQVSSISSKFIHSSMASHPFLGPWPLLQFRNLFFTQTVGLLGRVISQSQGCYLHTGQHEHRINAHTDIHALSGIRTHDPSVPASKYSSCLIIIIIILIILSGVRLSPLGTAASTGQSQMTDDECGAVDGMRIGKGNRSTRREPVPVPLCPPQIPHDLTRAGTGAAAVGSQRLTA
jgi:hypothetical protein